MYYIVYKGKKCQIFDEKNDALVYNKKYYGKIKKCDTLEEANQYLKSYNIINNGFENVNFTFEKIDKRQYNFILNTINTNNNINNNNNRIIFYEPNYQTIEKTKKILELEEEKKNHLKEINNIENEQEQIELLQEEFQLEEEKLQRKQERLNLSYKQNKLKIIAYNNYIEEVNEKLKELN